MQTPNLAKALTLFHKYRQDECKPLIAMPLPKRQLCVTLFTLGRCRGRGVTETHRAPENQVPRPLLYRYNEWVFKMHHQDTGHEPARREGLVSPQGSETLAAQVPFSVSSLLFHSAASAKLSTVEFFTC